MTDVPMPKFAPDCYRGRASSYVWATLFGPIYYLWFRHWREFIITLLLYPFGVGVILSPFLTKGAWMHRAQQDADAENVNALLYHLIKRVV